MTATFPSVGRSGSGVSRLVLPRLPAAWAHVTRVVLAAWLALYIAYFVQLDSPYWATTTVLVVANPTRGALFSKSQWRILGTIVGAVAMVTLTAAFPQQPVLFMAGVAVWLGIFTFIASLMRFFRAYGAVLAGFTISLIAFARIEHPETLIYIAFARVSAVMIGVLSIAFVSLILHGAIGEFELERRAAYLLGAVARLLHDDLQGQPDRSPHSEQAQISHDLAAFEEVIEYASVELFDIRRRSNALRIGVAELFGALVAGTHTMGMVRDAVDGMPGRHGADDPAVSILNEALTQSVRLSRSPDATVTDEMLRVLQTARDELGTLIRDCANGTYLMALADARELLDRLSRAVRSIGAARGDARPGPIRLRAYLDWRTALRNGLRAMIAMGLGSLFWIATAWPSGGSMLAMLGVVCGLLATNPSCRRRQRRFCQRRGTGCLVCICLQVRSVDPCHWLSVACAFDAAVPGRRRLRGHQAAFDPCRGSAADLFHAIGRGHQPDAVRSGSVPQCRLCLHLRFDLRGVRLPHRAAAQSGVERPAAVPIDRP